MLKRHWKEIGVNQKYAHCDPQWDLLFQYDLTGVLHILTARNEDDLLVGYIFNLVGPHMHHASTRFAATTMYWLDPLYRQGWFPVQMFLENMRGLREREVDIHTINIMLHFQSGRVGRIFQRLGYKPTEILFQKVLRP